MACITPEVKDVTTRLSVNASIVCLVSEVVDYGWMWDNGYNVLWDNGILISIR